MSRVAWGPPGGGGGPPEQTARWGPKGSGTVLRSAVEEAAEAPSHFSTAAFHNLGELGDDGTAT